MEFRPGHDPETPTPERATKESWPFLRSTGPHACGLQEHKASKITAQLRLIEVYRAPKKGADDEF